MAELLDARGLTEAEAIARSRSRNYPKPAVTADIAVLIRGAKEYKILLVRRGGHPFLGKLALPGGFADAGESIEQASQVHGIDCERLVEKLNEYFSRAAI